MYLFSGKTGDWISLGACDQDRQTNPIPFPRLNGSCGLSHPRAALLNGTFSLASPKLLCTRESTGNKAASFDVSGRREGHVVLDSSKRRKEGRGLPGFLSCCPEQRLRTIAPCYPRRLEPVPRQSCGRVRALHGVKPAGQRGATLSCSSRSPHAGLQQRKSGGFLRLLEVLTGYFKTHLVSILFKRMICW